MKAKFPKEFRNTFPVVCKVLVAPAENQSGPFQRPGDIDVTQPGELALLGVICHPGQNGQSQCGCDRVFTGINTQAYTSMAVVTTLSAKELIRLVEESPFFQKWGENPENALQIAQRLRGLVLDLQAYMDGSVLRVVADRDMFKLYLAGEEKPDMEKPTFPLPKHLRLMVFKPIKVLVSLAPETFKRVARRSSDFSFTEEGEFLVLPAMVCANGCSCGCARSFVGVRHAKATTFGRVVEVDPNTYFSAIEKSTWYQG